MKKRFEDMTTEEMKEEVRRMEAWLALSWWQHFVADLQYKGPGGWYMTVWAWGMLLAWLNLLRILLRPFIAW